AVWNSEAIPEWAWRKRLHYLVPLGPREFHLRPIEAVGNVRSLLDRQRRRAVRLQADRIQGTPQLRRVPRNHEPDEHLLQTLLTVLCCLMSCLEAFGLALSQFRFRFLRLQVVRNAIYLVS